MTWFRVDDTLAMHSKARAAGLHAMGLWLMAGAWSSQQLTGGYVPAHMLVALGGTRKLALSLVAAGLWVEHDAGYCFHDWEHYQPSAAEVRADRATKHEAKAKAGRSGGIASGVARRSNAEAEPKQSRSRAEAEGKHGVEANAKQNEAPSRPYPSLPKTKNTSQPLAPTPSDAAESNGQRVNRLARTYTDRVPLSAFLAVQAVVKLACKSDFTDAQIVAGLTELADTGRPVTANTLRMAIEPPKPYGKPVGDGRASATDAEYLAPSIFDARSAG